MSGETEILNANAAYYRAFRQGDDALMGRVWHEADVVCLHPGWPPITGRAAVLASYRRIMSNPNQPPVTCHDEQVIITGDVARVICVEAVAGACACALSSQGGGERAQKNDERRFRRRRPLFPISLPLSLSLPIFLPWRRPPRCTPTGTAGR